MSKVLNVKRKFKFEFPPFSNDPKNLSSIKDDFGRRRMTNDCGWIRPVQTGSKRQCEHTMDRKWRLRFFGSSLSLSRWFDIVGGRSCGCQGRVRRLCNFDLLLLFVFASRVTNWDFRYDMWLVDTGDQRGQQKKRKTWKIRKKKKKKKMPFWMIMRNQCDTQLISFKYRTRTSGGDRSRLSSSLAHRRHHRIKRKACCMMTMMLPFLPRCSTSWFRVRCNFFLFFGKKHRQRSINRLI